MLCPIEDQRRGEWEARGWECCVKRVQANERDKRGCGCIQCADGVSVSEATSKPHSPLLPLCRRRWKHIGEGNQLRYCNWWKSEVEDLEESSLGPGVSPLLSPSSLRVECGAVWAWRYKPEQRSLEARNERAETSFAITFETGPNASLRPTIVHRLLVFLDEAFRPKREKEEGQKRAETSRRLQCFLKTDHR